MRAARGFAVALCVVAVAACSADPGALQNQSSGYPWHRSVVATTFWIGEVFDPTAEDGSQVFSTYDSEWLHSYGGCDGIVIDGVCQTERRLPDNGYFPRHMVPRENPFYLDLPFDDVNNAAAFAMRAQLVPWAHEAGLEGRSGDPAVSLMKNRWVRLRKDERVCYGQIEDAGPGRYDDAAYVFGDDDRRPANTAFNSAGLDVSPALNGCLGFVELNGESDRVDWQFVDDSGVPPGPWRTIVTTSGMRQ